MKQDSAWKDVLDDLFPEFLVFFFPDIHRGVNWQRKFGFLDKELREIIREGESGGRIVDKLVKVFLLDGSENWILIHVEIQGSVRKEFARQREARCSFTIFVSLRNTIARSSVWRC